jgi:hypothetical protein
MSNAEWITDRLPTEADGDMEGNVWMRHVSSPEHNFFAHWSHVGPGAPWQRTSYWKPTAEPDRIKPTPTEPTPTEPDWAALGWITHRQPTKADADYEGAVWLPRNIADPIEGDTTFVDYRTVALGQPWYSRHAPEMQDGEPTPTEPDRIAALEQRVAELEAMVRPSAELPAERLRLPVDHCIRLDRACLGD